MRVFEKLELFPFLVYDFAMLTIVARVLFAFYRSHIQK